jgi:hypothetical protein
MADLKNALAQSVNSREDSFLDDYGYDMVFAATLGSINTAMRQYITKVSDDAATKILRVYYTRNAEKKYVEVSPEVTAALNALSLFSIPNVEAQRIPEQIAAIETARREKIYYGFEVELGLPEWVGPSDRIIDFETGETGNHAKVKYNVPFKQLNIFEFIIDWDDYEYHTVLQGENKWVFSFTVDLGLVGVTKDNLPDDIKKIVNNIDPASMFSINQLYLDMNTPYLMSYPQIIITEDAKAVFERNFVDRYFKTLEGHAGNPVFAYTVTLPQGGGKRFLLTPEDFRFWVSPYFVNGKPDTSRKYLYTLNYIVQCEKDKPINLREFTWNWVDAEEYGAGITGALVISNTQVYKFAADEYIKLIENLLYTTVATVSVYGIKITFSLGIEKDISAKAKFDKAVYSYEKKTHCSDSGKLAGTTNIDFNYTLDATLRNYKNPAGECVLECAVVTKLYLNIDNTFATSAGNIYNMKTSYSLTISVDNQGKLMLSPHVETEDIGADFDMSLWDRFALIGLKDDVEDIQNKFTEKLNENKKLFDKAFENTYNGNSVWYIPGSGSLVFNQPCFSNKTDLTLEAAYAAP